MTNETWLYLYENKENHSIYIGIGDNMGRVFGPHNPEAEELRDSLGTLIRQTVEPFSSREDALKAEAIAIHVASLIGLKTLYNPDQESELYNLDYDLVTNIQGKKSTKHLGPAIFTREGKVSIEDLQETVIVPISPKDIAGRASAWGGNSGEVFAERAASYWNIALHKRQLVKRLVAVLTGPRRIILGSWEIDPSMEWHLIPDHKNLPSPYSTRVSVPILQPNNDNYNGIKGKEYIGRLNQGVSYSPDIR
ncbi:hypothetical protein ACUH88_05760 [Dermabacteraceae bacterium P13095]